MASAAAENGGHRDWLSTIEVSELLDLTPRDVHALIDRGELPSRRVGRTHLVRRESAERLLGERGDHGATEERAS